MGGNPVCCFTLATNQIPNLHSNLTHWQRRELAVFALTGQTLLAAALKGRQKQFARRGQLTNLSEFRD